MLLVAFTVLAYARACLSQGRLGPNRVGYGDPSTLR